MRILFLTSSYTQSPTLRDSLRPDREALERAHMNARAEDSITWVTNVDPETIRFKPECEVIHCSFHGNDDQTILSNEYDIISHTDFVESFGNRLKSKVMILNICYSDDLAKLFNEDNARHCWILGWSGNVPIKIVAKVTGCFYSNLFAGSSFSDCFQSIQSYISHYRRDLTDKELEMWDLVVFPPNPPEPPPPSPPERIKKKFIIIALFCFAAVSIIVLFLSIPGEGPKTYCVHFSNLHDSSLVNRTETVKVSVIPRAGGKPWLFISPIQENPILDRTGWYPQMEGRPMPNNEWEFHVNFGDQGDSCKKFKTVAMVVNRNVVVEMNKWLSDQLKNSPLDNKELKACFWYCADSITTQRYCPSTLKK